MRPLFLAGAALLISGTLLLLHRQQSARVLLGPGDRNTTHRTPVGIPRPQATPPVDATMEGNVQARVQEIARIRAEIAEAPPLQRRQLRNTEVIKLLERLAELDPEGAILLAFEQEKVHGDPELAGKLFTTWLGRSTEKAEQWFETLPTGALRSRITPEIIPLFAAKNPTHALELLNGLQGELRRRSIGALFSGWSEHAPASAATEALRLASKDERELALHAVAEIWSQADLSEAVAWQSTLSWGGAREAALRGLLPEWAASAPEQVAAFGAGIPADRPIHDEWLRVLTEQWAAQDTDAALQWAQTLPSQHDCATALRIAAAELAKEGNAAAAERMLTLPPGEARQQALELVLNPWAAADPGAAAQWCLKLPPGQLRDALRVVGPAWARREPQSLAAALPQLLDQSLRDTLIGAVAEAWAIRQPTAAAEWALTQLSEQDRRQAVRHLVPVWADRNPQGIGDWVNGLSSGPDRDFAAARLSDYLLPKSPDAAAEWAGAITNRDERQSQMEHVFFVWTEKDPVAARQWFGETFEVHAKPGR